MNEPVPSPAYADTDLVYVDPELKTVIGPLEWSRLGNPKSKPMPPKEGEGKGDRRGKRFYPFGTYRSMKRAFSLEGKIKKTDSGKPMDEVLKKAIEQTYWE